MKGFCLSSKFTEGVGWLEIPKPEIQSPYDAILEPVAVSPCTSDVHSARSNSGSASIILGKAGQTRPDTVLGHEAVGRIVELGPMVKDFNVGDVVAVPCVTPNWLTLDVQEGQYQHSGGQNGGRYTSLRGHGVFGEYFLIPFADMNLAKIPEGVSVEAAVMATDMITTGFGGAEMANVSFGDTVVVMGIGPVGLMAIAGAALRGAGRIIGVGNRRITRDLAIEYGAETTISYKDGPVIEQLIETLGDRKADSVILCGGNESSVTEALSIIRTGGHFANLLGLAGDIVIHGKDIGVFVANKNIVGNLCAGGRVRTERMLSVVKSGRLDPTKMLTHKFQGLDAIEPAFNLMAKKPPELVKPFVYI